MGSFRFIGLITDLCSDIFGPNNCLPIGAFHRCQHCPFHPTFHRSLADSRPFHPRGWSDLDLIGQWNVQSPFGHRLVLHVTHVQCEEREWKGWHFEKWKRSWFQTEVQDVQDLSQQPVEYIHVFPPVIWEYGILQRYLRIITWQVFFSRNVLKWCPAGPKHRPKLS